MTAAALLEARPGEFRDAVGGVVPRTVVTPASIEEAAAAVAECARDRRAIAFVGGGTDLGIGSPPRSLDTVLGTSRLTRVIEHAPSDQIVVAEAGIPLDELSRTLAAHGQRLALDPPLPGRATVGGVVAANAFGPLRTRFGGPRDLIIGITVVRADGTVARGGGKVVKNVAGFDLPRMMVGSLGSLGLVATASFRLHPLPETTETLLFRRLSTAAVLALSSRLREHQLEPSAVTALGAGGWWDVTVVFQGFPAGVASQRDQLKELARTSGESCDLLSPAEAQAARARHDEIRTTPPFRLKVAAPLASFGAPLSVPALVEAAFEDPAAVWYPTLGIEFASGRPAAETVVVAAIGSVRAAVAPLRGSLVVQAAPLPLLGRIDPWGDSGSAFGLLRSLKERLDPDGCLSPGRFAGGL